ncbi:MAG: NifU family protein [Bacteroidales bacterium]|nr:NifU family protein [Bacteroidales bacterium]
MRLFALNLKQINVMEKQELIQKIKNILLQIKPYLAADGGGVEFVDLTDDMVVLVELTGACGNCPHSSRTLKNGIEKTIKSILPEIKAVENVK